MKLKTNSLLFVFSFYSFLGFAQTGQWTWVNGDSILDQNGIYGNKGIASPNNKPGARVGACSWTDKTGDFWIYGGTGYGNSNRGNNDLLSDLWKYNIASNQWTWVGGDSSINQKAVYGKKRIPAPNNKPGSRRGAMSWTDKQGNFWLFSGQGNGSTNIFYSSLDDLWKYDVATNQWTWVEGTDSIVPGNYGAYYGTKGVPSKKNMPLERFGGHTWTDLDGNLWLYGGYTYNLSGGGNLNDLWKFDITTFQWTWVGGERAVNKDPIYGTIGISDSLVNPGSVISGTTFVDRASGDLWLFGGGGMPQKKGFPTWGYPTYNNNLWKYSIKTNQWTFIKGNNNLRYTTYKTKGVGDDNNLMIGRSGCVSWVDNQNNFWLFGGGGLNRWDSTTINNTNYPGFNDLWKYDLKSNQWAYISGDTLGTRAITTFTVNLDSTHAIRGYDEIVKPFATYGTKGIKAPSNLPGGRSGLAFADTCGSLWLFGCSGYSTPNSPYQKGFVSPNWGKLNDLWHYDMPEFVCEPKPVIVKCNDSLTVPNAFSPNGDNFNDFLSVIVPNATCIKEIELRIYNRWGNSVFESTNITDRWDGNYKGKTMDAGVFVYYVTATLANNDIISRKGNVTLMR